MYGLSKGMLGEEGMERLHKLLPHDVEVNIFFFSFFFFFGIVSNHLSSTDLSFSIFFVTVFHFAVMIGVTCTFVLM